jgi:hypothetical protein
MRRPWLWSCHLPGRPQVSDDRGNAADLDGAKRQFPTAWACIRASLTDQDIADAHRIAAISKEALAHRGLIDDMRPLRRTPTRQRRGQPHDAWRSRTRLT